MKKLPKEVFITWDGDTDTPFLHAELSAEELLIDSDAKKIKVGIYELVEQVSAIREVIISKEKE